MFEGFTLERIDVGDAELRVRHGGSGPAVLLLHGHPRTHVTWHKVAPVLAERFTVVCPDLRGYGESSKPPTTPDHAPYSKRAMAGDCAVLMRALGHERFGVAGHDRGTYVAQRLTMDHPDLVSRVCLMEGHTDRGGTGPLRRLVRGQLVSLVLPRPDPKPAERFINADPDAWYTATPSIWARKPSRTTAARSTIPRRCMPWSRTTARAWASTATTMRPTGRQDGGSAVPCCSCGPGVTTWKTSTATLWPSGVNGPTTFDGQSVRLWPPHRRGSTRRTRRSPDEVLHPDVRLTPASSS